MAASLAAELAHEHGLEVEARSRGTHALVGEPAARKAVAACAERAVDLSAHRAAQLSAEDVQWAEVIFVMEDDHARTVGALAPERADDIVRMGPLAGRHQIDDPYGSWFMPPFRRARDELIAALRRWFSDRARPARP